MTISRVNLCAYFISMVLFPSLMSLAKDSKPIFKNRFNSYLLKEKEIRLSALTDFSYGLSEDFELGTNALLSIGAPNLSIKHHMYSVKGSTTSLGFWGGFLNLFDPQIDGEGNFFLLSLLNSSKTKNSRTYTSGFWFLDLNFNLSKLPSLISFKRIKGALRSYGGLLGFDFQLTNNTFINSSFILSSFDYLSIETESYSRRNLSFYTCLLASSLYVKEEKWTFELTGFIFLYKNSVAAFPYLNIYYSV